MVSVLFIQLETVEFNSNGIDKLQEIFSFIERAVFNHDGHIRQLICDDKGTVVIAGFGLPQHEDDPLRAASCALQINSKFPVSIGVTTGSMLCGIVGSTRSRCEFALIGNPVNLAARLMSKGHGKVLCDQATRNLTKVILFEWVFFQKKFPF